MDIQDSQENWRNENWLNEDPIGYCKHHIYCMELIIKIIDDPLVVNKAKLAKDNMQSIIDTERSRIDASCTKSLLDQANEILNNK